MIHCNSPSVHRIGIHLEPLEPRLLLSSSPLPATDELDPATPLRINVGGPAYIDSLGRPFAADSGFTGGSIGESPFIVENMIDDTLFNTFRRGGSFSFSHPLADGNYALWLHFAEPEQIGLGERVFDVLAGGEVLLDSFDIRAHAEPRQAWSHAFDIEITGGSIDLEFRGVMGEAIVSAILLVPTDIPPEVLPYSHLALDEAGKQAQSATNLRHIGLAAIMYGNENRDRLPDSLVEIRAKMDTWHSIFASPRTSTLLPRGELSLLEEIAWVAARNDYIYLGAGRTLVMGHEDVLAYENPDRVAGDIVVMFGDSSVRVLDREEAAALIGFAPDPPTDPPPPAPPIPPADLDVLLSRVNLLRIGHALIMHANEHQDRFPLEPGELYAKGFDVEPSTFINPRTGTTSPPDDWTLQQKMDWINASTDFVYLAGGKTVVVPAHYVLMHENPEGLSGGINLLLGAGGQVEFREMRWAMESIVRNRLRVMSAEYRFDASPPGLHLSLSHALPHGHQVQLTNLTTGEDIPQSQLQFSMGSSAAASLRFTGSSNGVLPDGVYRATVPAGWTARHAAPMGEDFVFHFFVLAGDANRDGTVDAIDLGILAANWQQSGTTFSQGDFNYDGTVGIADLGVLAANWQKSLDLSLLSAEASADEAPLSADDTPAIITRRDRSGAPHLPVQSTTVRREIPPVAGLASRTGASPKALDLLNDIESPGTSIGREDSPLPPLLLRR